MRTQAITENLKKKQCLSIDFYLVDILTFVMQPNRFNGQSIKRPEHSTLMC